MKPETTLKPELIVTEEEIARQYLLKHPRYSVQAVMRILNVGYVTALKYFTSGALKGIKSPKGWSCNEEQLTEFLNRGMKPEEQ